jgi:hypothetical protein
VSEPRFVDDYLGYLLGQANHAMYKDFDSQVRAAGLSMIEWRVLATLHDSTSSANWLTVSGGLSCKVANTRHSIMLSPAARTWLSKSLYKAWFACPSR